MRKTFPLAMLADLGLDGDTDTSKAKKSKRKRASKIAANGNGHASESGSGNAEALFSRLAKALAPSEDDVDQAWFEMNAG